VVEKWCFFIAGLVRKGGVLGGFGGLVEGLCLMVNCLGVSMGATAVRVRPCAGHGEGLAEPAVCVVFSRVSLSVRLIAVVSSGLV
jgi:hypothetical protein